jgi:hypothetical protein
VHLRPIEKGALLGLSNVIVIALGVALLVLERGRPEVLGNGCGNMSCPAFIEPHFGALEVFLVILIHGLPCGIALGILAGNIAGDNAEDHVRDRYVMLLVPMLAFVFCCVGLLWEALAVQMVLPTVIHVVILDRWTRPPTLDIGRAWVRKSGRPRSTSTAGARSTAPKPRPSDTSRTIR